MLFRLEHDAATGEVKEIPLTKEEIKEAEIANAAFIAKRQELLAIKEAEEAAKRAEKEAIAAKIGLTVDEVITLLS